MVLQQVSFVERSSLSQRVRYRCVKNGCSCKMHKFFSLFCPKVGDTIDITGPAGKVIYLGRGYMRVKYPGKPEEIRFATDIGLISGGTGVCECVCVCV